MTTAKVLATLIELSKERGLPQLFEIEYYKNARDSTIPITCLEHKAAEIRTSDQYVYIKRGGQLLCPCIYKKG